MTELENLFTPQELLDIAEKYKTPCYVYNQQKILENLSSYQTSFNNKKYSNFLICYAVKANSNINILKLLANCNSGFDIVSLGELERVIKAGGNPNKVVFSGVGKQDFEIERALEAGIYCFNIESESELELINKIATKLNTKAPISIRVNPNIDAKSHPYISTGLKEHKFGIAIEQAENIYNYAKDLSHLEIKGIDCHIGSQLTELDPIKQTCDALNNLISKLKQNNIHLTHLNLGGGLGIDYEHGNTQIPTINNWVDAILDNIKFDGKILLEPGRSIIGNAGVLLTKVIYNKKDLVHNHNFTIVDAAMNDLMRPALYSAYHKIINITPKSENTGAYTTSIVGPVCESSDVFAKDIELYANPNDILAILDTGAYGISMSSNYNTRPRACEILIDSGKIKVIRKRESIEDLYQLEILE